MDYTHNHISGVTIGVGQTDLSVIKEFYTQVFGWTFTFESIVFLSFTDGTIEGIFHREKQPTTDSLLSIYSEHIEKTKTAIEEAGGSIIGEMTTSPTYSHFTFRDPSGNEFTVWSDRYI